MYQLIFLGMVKLAQFIQEMNSEKRAAAAREARQRAEPLQSSPVVPVFDATIAEKDTHLTVRICDRQLEHTTRELHTVPLTELKTGDSVVVLSADRWTLVLKSTNDCELSHVGMEQALRKALLEHTSSQKMAILGKGSVVSYDSITRVLKIDHGSPVSIGFRNISPFNA